MNLTKYNQLKFKDVHLDALQHWKHYVVLYGAVNLAVIFLKMNRFIFIISLSMHVSLIVNSRIWYWVW